MSTETPGVAGSQVAGSQVAGSQVAGGQPAVESEPEPVADEVTSLLESSGVPWVRARGEVVGFPPAESYPAVVSALRGAGFDLCSDLCAVDYLRHMNRWLPEGVTAGRFEIVVTLTSLERRERMRVRVQVHEEDPRVESLFRLYPGSEAMEREAFDMFGIRFEGHPDLTRILMPEDWEGHPLRKDYSPGRVPVQFKGAPGPR